MIPRSKSLTLALALSALAMLAFLTTAPARLTAVQAVKESGAAIAYLPVALAPPSCSQAGGAGYGSGPAFQADNDNPVRKAWNHADKNLDLRSYVRNNDANLVRALVNYGSDDPTQPPQLATLFQPARVPLHDYYRVHDWNWAPSPNPGTRGAPLASWPVTGLGLSTTPGEKIHVPTSGYNIGGAEVIILYADENNMTLRYTREDSSATGGYTVHIDGVCPDPALRALYAQHDNSNGPRYLYKPPSQRPYSYSLPQLAAGQVLGQAIGGEIVVAITDTGAFLDPRSCNEWWQIRPGYTGSC